MQSGLFIECFTHNSTVNVNQIHFAENVNQYAIDYLSGTIIDNYFGPEFKVLDEGVQQEFINLLSQLGITDDLGSFIEVMAVDKDHRNYINWLKKVGSEISH